jgi:GT2 family glycosyltransferase
MTGTIAVLMTCHNRKVTTLKCLGGLTEHALPSGYRLAIHLVDDGSTDGTADAIASEYPDVHLIRADGSLFWSGGMYLAWRHAAGSDPEFYLWMNDDTYLLPGAVKNLVHTWSEYAAVGRDRCIVVASCYDPQTGKHSYGGEMIRGAHPARPIPVHPDPHVARECATFNGNCVLVPRATFQVLGFMRRFSHSMSDTDYGLYASRCGIPVVVAPGYCAECELNPVFKCPHSAWQDPSLPRIERWRKLVNRRGLPPMDWWRFLWAHAGIRALWYWPTPYLRVLLGR